MRIIRFLMVLVFLLAAVNLSLSADRSRPNADSAAPNADAVSSGVENPDMDLSVWNGHHRISRFYPLDDGENLCYRLRTYLMKRESRDSDVTRPVGYTTCQPARRFDLKTAVQVPRADSR